MVNKDNWKIIKLGDLNEFVGETVNPLNTPNNFYEMYSVPSFVENHPECIVGKEIGSTKQRVQEDDVLICKINPRINRVWIVERYTRYPIIASSEWIVVRNKKACSRYLAWYFRSKIFKNMMVSQVTGIGGSLTRAQPKQVKTYPVPLPPIEIQKQIAAILDKASELIELRKQQLAKMDLLIKSKFIAMFGDEKTAFLKWECKRVSDLAEVNVGVVIKPAQYYTNKDVGTKTFRSLNIGEMKVKDTEWVYFSEEGNRLNRKSILREGQLLIVRSGYPGTACVVTKEYEGCNAIDVIIATPDFKKVNSVFLCAYTNYAHGKNQIMRGQYGAAQQHFNVGAYKNLIVGVPPLALQNEFAAFVDKVERQKSVMKASLAKLEINYKALMQQYFG